MNSKDYPIGAMFQNKETKRIVEVVVDDDGKAYFEDVEYGDLYLDVDEDLYERIY